MSSVPSIVVLADDLTGAAEIAAIGVEHGLKTELATSPPVEVRADLLVVDTDTRPLTGAEASAKLRGILAGIPRAKTVFKKTDSVLRGQVVAEIAEMRAWCGDAACLLVPQNPSKNRVIVGGRYLINGVPLDETPFRNDPEYPRTTANVQSLLESSATGTKLEVVELPGGQLRHAINVGNATSLDEVRRWAMRGVKEKCLLAGGADLFRALLETTGNPVRPGPAVGFPKGRVLIACGSADVNSRETVQRWKAQGVAVCLMPEGSEEDTCARNWAQTAAVPLQREVGVAILAIGHGLSATRAKFFRRCMAGAVRRTIDEMEGDFTLIVEGGATAAAVAEAHGWRTFDVLGHLAPGVVMLRLPTPFQESRLVLKPGSYPWPSGFIERFGLVEG